MLSRRALLLLSFLSLTPGCATLGAPGREEMLRLVREYNDALRWGRPEQVLPRMSPEARARYKEKVGILGEELEIVDYDILGIEMGNKGKEAQVKIRWSWMERSSGTLQQTTVMQQWVDKDHDWKVARHERLRGPALPLSEEPKPAPPPKGTPEKAPEKAPEKPPEKTPEKTPERTGT
jgi:hypothetical protein